MNFPLAGVTRIDGEIVEYERNSSGNSSGLCCLVRRNINRIQNYFESTDWCRCHSERYDKKWKEKLRLPVNNIHRQTLELAGRIPGSSRRPKQNRANRRGISVLTSRNRFVPESFRSIRTFICIYTCWTRNAACTESALVPLRCRVTANRRNRPHLQKASEPFDFRESSNEVLSIFKLVIRNQQSLYVTWLYYCFPFSRWRNRLRSKKHPEKDAL